MKSDDSNSKKQDNIINQKIDDDIIDIDIFFNKNTNNKHTKSLNKSEIHDLNDIRKNDDTYSIKNQSYNQSDVENQNYFIQDHFLNNQDDKVQNKLSDEACKRYKEIESNNRLHKLSNILKDKSDLTSKKQNQIQRPVLGMKEPKSWMINQQKNYQEQHQDKINLKTKIKPSGYLSANKKKHLILTHPETLKSHLKEISIKKELTLLNDCADESAFYVINTPETQYKIIRDDIITNTIKLIDMRISKSPEKLDKCIETWSLACNKNYNLFKYLLTKFYRPDRLSEADETKYNKLLTYTDFNQVSTDDISYEILSVLKPYSVDFELLCESYGIDKNIDSYKAQKSFNDTLPKKADKTKWLTIEEVKYYVLKHGWVLEKIEGHGWDLKNPKNFNQDAINNKIANIVKKQTYYIFKHFETQEIKVIMFTSGQHFIPLSSQHTKLTLNDYESHEQTISVYSEEDLGSDSENSSQKPSFVKLQKRSKKPDNSTLNKRKKIENLQDNQIDQNMESSDDQDSEEENNKIKIILNKNVQADYKSLDQIGIKFKDADDGFNPQDLTEPEFELANKTFKEVQKNWEGRDLGQFHTALRGFFRNYKKDFILPCIDKMFAAIQNDYANIIKLKYTKDIKIQFTKLNNKAQDEHKKKNSKSLDQISIKFSDEKKFTQADIDKDEYIEANKIFKEMQKKCSLSTFNKLCSGLKAFFECQKKDSTLLCIDKLFTAIQNDCDNIMLLTHPRDKRKKINELNNKVQAEHKKKNPKSLDQIDIKFDDNKEFTKDDIGKDEYIEANNTFKEIQETWGEVDLECLYIGLKNLVNRCKKECICPLIPALLTAIQNDDDIRLLTTSAEIRKRLQVLKEAIECNLKIDDLKSLDQIRFYNGSVFNGKDVKEPKFILANKTFEEIKETWGGHKVVLLSNALKVFFRSYKKDFILPCIDKIFEAIKDDDNIKELNKIQDVMKKLTKLTHKARNEHKRDNPLSLNELNLTFKEDKKFTPDDMKKDEFTEANKLFIAIQANWGEKDIGLFHSALRLLAGCCKKEYICPLIPALLTAIQNDDDIRLLTTSAEIRKRLVELKNAIKRDFKKENPNSLTQIDKKNFNDVESDESIKDFEYEDCEYNSEDEDYGNQLIGEIINNHNDIP